MNTELDDLIGVDYGEEYYPSRQMTVIKKDGTADPFNIQKVLNAVSKSAFRASVTFTEGDRRKICENIISRVDALPGTEISIAMMHNIVEQTLDLINPAVAKSYRDYRNYKQDFVKMLDEVYKKSQSIMYIGDKENSNTDSALVSTKRSLVFNQLNKELYKKFFLTTEELQACNDGYIYIHDMSARRDTMNCSLFDVGNVLKGGFEMGNVWYNEPKTLDTAFDVIGDIVLSGASQQYGGFTVPEVDKILAPYAEKSYTKYYNEYLSILQENGITENAKTGADAYAMKKVKRDFMQGVQGWEYKFNTVSSSRGDYPFITMTFGIGTSRFEKMASIAMLDVRREGQGKKDRKKPVLFPKLVFLYDENLHGHGKPLEDVFEAGIKCSAKTMYPDWLSLTGNGYVPSMYKQYGRVVSPMGCVDGKEIITYKIDGKLYVESFARFWEKFNHLAKGQYYPEDKNLYADLSSYNVEIWDTEKGFVKVTKIIRNISKKWNTVKLSNGRSLLCTEDHPFETQNRGIVYAKNLQKTDKILINSNQYSEENKVVDDLYAWGLGVILCDGCYANSKVTISINSNGEDEIESDLSKFAEKYYNMKLRIVNQNRGHKGIYKDLHFKATEDSETLISVDEKLAKLFGGYKKSDRQIPNEVFEWNYSAKLAFLAGMIDADGFINNKSHGGSIVQIGSTNKELALEQAALARTLGMSAKIYENNYTKTNENKRYRVEFYCIEELLSYIKCEKKKNNYKEESHYGKTILYPVESTVTEVISIEKEDFSYDVSTESEHFEVSGIYSHNCRAFLSPWYERGGIHPADKDDKPIFVGRFNIGVVSLHLPMILAKARQENKDFYDVLDYYLELIRKLHIRTYAYLGEMRASTNPLAYCEGGFLGGHLKPSDKIKPLLKPMTASFGITALNELQELYNGKSLVEDGTFAVEVMEYINAKVNQFKEEDDILYALYGTPAENLCFSGDTEVNTPFGMKRIKDIVAGDIVYSYNENTKKVEEKQVLTSQKTQDHAVVVKITLTENKSVICTPNHPIAIAKEPSMDPFHWDNRFEYIEAKDLKKDQKVIICGDVPYAGTSDLYKVVSVEYLQDLIPVYNIEVADNHNYFVGGNEGILVHNCGLQIKQFREKYGVIPNVSDRPYVSNSFHCHVTEDITPIEKQDLEHRFWNTMNGGKIQYVKYPVNYNIEAIKTLVHRAMQMGYYEGVNLSLAYCDDCGHQELEMDVCPVCGSRNLTKIERMNGYLSYSRVHGDTRLNDAKMAEIADRKSM